jgi:anaerobic selenocysteine-containing dehydrogenase
MINTACPLDCFDSCSLVVNPDNPRELIPSDLNPYTDGTLCPHLYKHFFEATEERVTKPMIGGAEVTMEEALDAVADAIRDKPWLLWRGSGNFGLIQQVTNLLAKEANGVITRGNLCDGAGEAGIIDGRGVNRLLPISQIEKSEVVVVWGRNIPVTNSHLMRYIEGKTLVVIDPRETKLSKMADLHLQVKPRSDFYLATILARFVMMESGEDREWLEEFGSEYDEYYDFTRGFRIKAILDYIGLSLDDIGDFLLMLQNRKVVFLVGAGVQRYDTGYYTLRAIDSFAAILGLFGKEGSGVSYLSNSTLGIKNPFEVKLKSELKAITPFSKYSSVIVQGGNPAESMPSSNRVIEELKGVDNLIYFGLYHNETSKLANIVIPAKTFLEKDDIRASYGNEYLLRMDKVIDSDIGISEYDFVQEILKRLNKEPIKSLSHYIDFIENQAIKDSKGRLKNPAFEEIPYKNGFGEDGGDEFEFNDDFYDDFEENKALTKFRKKVKQDDNSSFWLLTPKSNKTLNTQFSKGESIAYIPKGLNIEDGSYIEVKSQYGTLKLKAKVDSGLRGDTISILMGTKGVNKLTPPKSSLDGDNACYGDIKVKITKVI